MQALLDLLPVIAFFVAYQIADMQAAIIVIMVVSTIQLGVIWFLKREVNKMVLFSVALLLPFGVASLLLDSPLIFKWKPTVLYWLFAAVFVGSHFIGTKTIIQRLLESVAKEDFNIAAIRWRLANLIYAVGFLVMGTANIIVAYAYSEAAWVNFKLIAMIGFFVFSLALMMWLFKDYAPAEANPDGGE